MSLTSIRSEAPVAAIIVLLSLGLANAAVSSVCHHFDIFPVLREPFFFCVRILVDSQTVSGNNEIDAKFVCTEIRGLYGYVVWVQCAQFIRNRIHQKKYFYLSTDMVEGIHKGEWPEVKELKVCKHTVGIYSKKIVSIA